MLVLAILRYSPARRLHSMPRAWASPPDAARISIVAGVKKVLLRTGLEALYFTGAHRLLRPLVGGVGAILTLHHVRPPRVDAFQPNRLLEVTPVFLEKLLKRLKRSRTEVISLDEMHRRFITNDFKRRFVCLTFDDGYKDLMR